MSSSFEIKVHPKRHDGENKWLRFQLLEWLSFALLVTDVPAHLRNAPTPLMKKEGLATGYRYAHDEPEAYAAGESYFPAEMTETRY